MDKVYSAEVLKKVAEEFKMPVEELTMQIATGEVEPLIQHKLWHVKALVEIPKLVENPDLSELIEVCQMHLMDIAKGGHGEDEYYIYEAAMEALYGNKIFCYINDKE